MRTYVYIGPSGQPYPEEMGSHFEGDIVVLNGSNWRQSSGLMDSAYRWPDSTIIYEFDPKFGISLFLSLVLLIYKLFSNLTFDYCK